MQFKLEEFEVKKLLCCLLSLAFCLSLAACGSHRQSAQAVVEDAIQTVQTADLHAISQSWGGDFSTDLGAETDDANQEMFSAIAKNLTYSIVSSNEDAGAGTATVTVEFTNTNMQEVFAEYLSQMLSVAFEYAFLPEDEQPTEEEMNEMYLDTFMEVMEEKAGETVTSTVDIPLELVDDTWKISAEEDVIDAMFGVLYTYANSMNEAFSS